MIGRSVESQITWIALAVVLLLSKGAGAQKQANTWYFGERAGLSFIQNDPVTLHDSDIDSFGSPAVVSDPKTGKLLFYSNGEKVWNSVHVTMPNGTLLTGDRYATNNAYAVPYPGYDSLYYLFTLTQADYQTLRGASIAYSTVDLRLSGRTGDIAYPQRDIPFADDMTEKIAAVPHADNRGFWVITHRFRSNEFLVHSITEAGITPAGTYALGAVHTIDSTHDNTIVAAQGHMKASPDGRKLAATLRTVSGPPAPFQIFDFDPATGVISNPQTLGYYRLQYGVSFSPDSKKLYLHGLDLDGDTYDYLFQFDMSRSDVYASRVGLLINNPTLMTHDFAGGLASFDLQLGPDGRLYGAGIPGQTDAPSIQNLVIIQEPNHSGYACSVTIQPFAFGAGRVNIGLPNFIQSIFQGLTPVGNPNAPCVAQSFDFFPNPIYDGVLNVAITDLCSEQFTLVIVDMMGRVIRSFEGSGDMTINLGTLAAGTYLAIVTSGTRTLSVKLVKV